VGGRWQENQDLPTPTDFDISKLRDPGQVN
jgi:hypothetical protein